MKNSFFSISILGGVLFVNTALAVGWPNFDNALVRGLSNSFEDSLKQNPPPIPIDLGLARKQHAAYIEMISKHVPNVVEIPADDAHPDCNFIEDTAIIVGDTAVISIMGARERRGEEIPVAKSLKKLGLKNIIPLRSPATMDGGDILFTGNHLFVGLSSRTNAEALKQLEQIFSDRIRVFGVPVTEGLHLKSVISFFDSSTLIVADSAAGHSIRDRINEVVPGAYEIVQVPDQVSANVLRMGSTVIVQKGFERSENILKELCDRKGVSLKTLDMSELIKADGALTCGSLLF